MMAPVVEAVSHEREGLLKVVKVNIDNEPLLGRRFSIRITPLFILYKHGKLISDITGGMSKEQLEAWIDSSLLVS